jgi:hypothetical protein
MPVAGIVTLVAIALTVLALAGYLLHVIWLLHRTSFALGTIVAGLRAIAFQTRPIGPIVRDIEADLAEVQTALEGILGVDLSGRYEARDGLVLTGPAFSGSRPGGPSWTRWRT